MLERLQLGKHIRVYTNFFDHQSQIFRYVTHGFTESALFAGRLVSVDRCGCDCVEIRLCNIGGLLDSFLN